MSAESVEANQFMAMQEKLQTLSKVLTTRARLRRRRRK